MKELTEKTKKQIKIVDNFLDKYYKSPSQSEFMKLGGDITYINRKFGTYRKFLEENGYDKPTHAKTYQVFDRNGNLVCEGLRNDVAKKMRVHPQTINHACDYGSKIRTRYRVVQKEVHYDDRT